MYTPAKRIGFILYDNRSGSTLLSAMLDCYPTIAVSAESDQLIPILEGPGANSPRRSVETEPGPQPALRERLRLAVGELSDPASGIAHQLIKEPRLHFHLRALRETFPGCAFLQIVRDGRAVFASKRRTRSPSGGPMDDNLLHAAWNWRRKLDIAAAFGDDVLTIRYEDLVRQPDATIGRVLDFLDVDESERRPTRKIADFFRRKIPASHRYLHQRLTGPLSQDYVEEWRYELAPHEVLLYERKNGPTLVANGYDIGPPGSLPPLGVRLRATALQATDVARWWLRLTVSALRRALTPRAFMQLVRSKYAEAKAISFSDSAGP